MKFRPGGLGILVVLSVFALSAFAAEPANGNLGGQKEESVWAGGPFYVPNPATTGGAVKQVPCDLGQPACDSYRLTVASGIKQVLIAIAPAQGFESDDYDLYVYNDKGIQIANDADGDGYESAVIDNDGWEHTEATDLFTLHDYARTGDDLTARYASLSKDPPVVPRNHKEALVFGARYNGTPLLMTEFGGIAFRLAGEERTGEWGYAGIEPTKERFLSRLDGLVKALVRNPAFAGFCYTQLTDVEQEINGLLTYDRKPKADLAEIKKIFEQMP
jgi:hypothetical protein